MGYGALVFRAIGIAVPVIRVFATRFTISKAVFGEFAGRRGLAPCGRVPKNRHAKPWLKEAAVLALAAGAALPATGLAANAGSSQVAVQVAALTLENARPMMIPPPPNLRPPAPIKAPPPFVTPQVMDTPDLPDLKVGPAPREAAPAPGTASQGAGTDTAAGTPPVPSADGAATPVDPPSQTAALPPPASEPPAKRPDGRTASLNIVFDGATKDLPADAEAKLQSVVERMRAAEGLRLELRSYASGTEETAREARLLSLTRASALRDRLEMQGIRRNRVDLRALGITAGEGPPDRIDLFLNE
jgi:outer membrane protein OmpA-like peptidoglycan-associated protein